MVFNASRKIWELACRDMYRNDHHHSEADTNNLNCTSGQTSFTYKFSIGIQLFEIGYFQLPTTRKKKRKTRKSKEAEMLSNLENMDITL